MKKFLLAQYSNSVSPIMATGEKPLPEVFIDFIKAVENMKSMVMVPHVLVDLSVETLISDGDGSVENDFPAGKELPAVPSGEDGGLYSHYQMLLRVKDEMTTGHKTDVNAAHFRNQVRDVVESLNYFTSLANAVTNNYCQVCEERNLGTFRRVASDSKLGAMKHAGELRAYRQRKFSAT